MALLAPGDLQKKKKRTDRQTDRQTDGHDYRAKCIDNGDTFLFIYPRQVRRGRAAEEWIDGHPARASQALKRGRRLASLANPPLRGC